MFSPTPEQIIDIQQRYTDGYPIRTILAHYDLGLADSKDYDTVFNICHKRRRFKNLADPPPWTPSCISEAEFIEWQTLNQVMTPPLHLVARPCDDCDRNWAANQRAAGCCNGTLQGEHAEQEMVTR